MQLSKSTEEELKCFRFKVNDDLQFPSSTISRRVWDISRFYLSHLVSFYGTQNVLWLFLYIHIGKDAILSHDTIGFHEENAEKKYF